MSYTDQATLVERFDQVELLAIADRDGDQVVDTGLIDDAIVRANAEIDSYLRAHYTLPLAEPVDPLLGDLAADIVRYKLQDDNPLDSVKARYEAAHQTLRRIANGQQHLKVEIPRSTLSVAIESPGRLFTHDSLAGF